MASFVNRRTTNGGRIPLLPKPPHRTAVDRLAYGCRGLSPHRVSRWLHQTLLQGSAARAPGRADKLTRGESRRKTKGSGFDARGITSPHQPLQQTGPAERLFVA